MANTDKQLIKRVQKALLDAGFDPGKIDGELGRRTTKAIKNFQEAKGLDIKWPGTLGPKTLNALGIDNIPQNSAGNLIDPPWVLEIRRRIGLQEKRDNKSLSEFLKSDGRFLGDPAKNPWCGDLQDTVIARTLPKEPLLSNPYWALNWQKFGVSLPSGMVPLGAIAPFKRPGGGHIGTIMGHDKNYYHVGGGNQSDSISIAKILKARLVGGLRWPATYDLPTMSMAMTSIKATVTHNES